MPEPPIRPHLYVLGGADGRTVVAVKDVLEWAKLFEFGDDKRRVGLTEVAGVRVSTVFLGIDHGFYGEPLLFETMCFSEAGNDIRGRWSSWDEAAESHELIVQELTKLQEPITAEEATQ